VSEPGAPLLYNPRFSEADRGFAMSLLVAQGPGLGPERVGLLVSDMDSTLIGIECVDPG